MNKVKGLNISKLGFKPLLMGDFINYEGSIVSHFTDADNPHEHYIYKWADSNQVCNRWLIAKTSEASLSKFLFQKISLLQLINQNEFVYLLDLDDDLNENQISIVKTADIPDEYLPDADSYFEERHYEDHALQLKEKLSNASNSLIFEHLMHEVSTLKQQQSETNQLLNVLIKQQNTNRTAATVLAEPAPVYTPQSKQPKIK
jgi:hypothetical protein